VQRRAGVLCAHLWDHLAEAVNRSSTPIHPPPHKHTHTQPRTHRNSSARWATKWSTGSLITTKRALRRCRSNRTCRCDKTEISLNASHPSTLCTPPLTLTVKTDPLPPTPRTHATPNATQPGYLRPLLPDAAPEQPESFESVMEDFESKLMPGVMHWQSPRWVCVRVLLLLVFADYGVGGYSGCNHTSPRLAPSHPRTPTHNTITPQLLRLVPLSHLLPRHPRRDAHLGAQHDRLQLAVLTGGDGAGDGDDGLAGQALRLTRQVSVF